MALLKFLKGNYNNLSNANIVEGQILICNDTAEMFVDVASDKRIKIGDFTVIGTLTELEALDATKVPTSRLYYVEDGNILARSNGTAWIQVNRQKTKQEMVEFLGLGSMAYLSEVSESNLNSALATKINAASGAQHSHDNKTVLDGITAEKVTAWDAAEGNAKGYADGLNTAMNTRVEALEAIDHEHANKALLDTYTQTEANLADAVAKKHAHTFNETELNKIVEGDVAKWNGVAADHLTSADKTTLENAIKEAKKAGTDANTNIETYKVANDARVLAVEEDVAEIVDGTNGILAQAKSYTDGKDSAMNTRVAALETAAPTHALKTEVEAVDAKFANYNTTVAQKAIDDAQDAEIAKKVAKTDYEADKATFATKTELGNVDAKFANYKTAADQKLIDDAQDVEIAKKVDKVEGKDLIATSEIERLATLKNYDDTSLAGRVTTAEGKITALETESAKHALKSDVEAEFAKYTKTADLPTDLGDFTNNAGYAKTADVNTELDKKVNKVEGYSLVSDTEIARLAEVDNYDDTEVRGLISANTTAISTEKSRAEGIESGLRTDINTVMGNYLKASDKTELEGKITAEENRAKGVEESLQTQINTIMSNPDAEGAINSINEFTQYVKDHGTIAEGMRTDINKNKEDIAANTQAITDIEAEMAEHTHSWNDLTDRPFYETESVLGEVLFEGTYECMSSSTEGVCWTEEGAPIVATVYPQDGEWYEVVIDGVAYNAQYHWEYKQMGYLGAESLGYEPSEYPFMIRTSTDGTRANIGLLATPGSHTVKVAKLISPSEIVCIEEKFIPESIARVSDMEAADATLSNRLSVVEAQLVGGGEGTIADLIEQTKTEILNKTANQDAVVLSEAQAYAIVAAENQVKALSDGQVTTNKNDIADIMEMLTWGSF